MNHPALLVSVQYCRAVNNNFSVSPICTNVLCNFEEVELYENPWKIDWSFLDAIEKFNDICELFNDQLYMINLFKPYK